ncbi:MAG: hypothetical protein LBK57_07895 [Clostridiales Family XIII bacterium]|nr:hypothetical protein [Clostridiales Family XIII bacterium]
MISILILDEERAYAALLAERLAAAGREFSVTANPPAADDTAPVSDGVRAEYDFVIMSESALARFAGRAGDAPGGARLIVLSESPQAPERAAGTDQGILYISRCGRVSALAAMIRAEYAVRPGSAGFARAFAGGAVKYIGCFGLAGGCGSSSVAIGIGRDFAAYKGRRVLYLSFESLEAGSLCVRDAEGERHIGDFMYLMLRKRDADLRLFSEACLFRDSYGLARFFPSPGLNDLARASPEETGDFLRFFDGCGAFDIIVLDFGSECGGAARELMHLCDVLVLAENGSLRDAGKRARAEAFAREAWRSDGEPVFAENMTPLSYDGDPREDGEIADTADDADYKTETADAKNRITIDFDEASFRTLDGMTDFVLSGEFGLGIHKLTDILLARICG